MPEVFNEATPSEDWVLMLLGAGMTIITAEAVWICTLIATGALS